jgi:hypothetical protein
MVSERIQRRIDALLDEADEAAATKNWAAVVENAEAVLGFDPGHEEATGYIAAAERALALGRSGNAGSASPVLMAPAQAAPEPSHPDSFVAGRYRERTLTVKVRAATPFFMAVEVIHSHEEARPALGCNSHPMRRLVRTHQARAPRRPICAPHHSMNSTFSRMHA